MSNLAPAKSVEKPAGNLEAVLIERAKHEPEIRLQRAELAALFAEIGDPALKGLLQATPAGSPICKIGNATLVVDLPPVRAVDAPPPPPDTERVSRLESDMTEVKGALAEILAALKGGGK